MSRSNVILGQPVKIAKDVERLYLGVDMQVFMLPCDLDLVLKMSGSFLWWLFFNVCPFCAHCRQRSVFGWQLLLLLLHIDYTANLYAYAIQGLALSLFPVVDYATRTVCVYWALASGVGVSSFFFKLNLQHSCYYFLQYLLYV